VYLSSESEEAEADAGSWDGVCGQLGGKGVYYAQLTRVGVLFDIIRQLTYNAHAVRVASYPFQRG
jgi:hypothetical protein